MQGARAGRPVLDDRKTKIRRPRRDILDQARRNIVSMNVYRLHCHNLRAFPVRFVPGGTARSVPERYRKGRWSPSVVLALWRPSSEPAGFASGRFDSAAACIAVTSGGSCGVVRCPEGTTSRSDATVSSSVPVRASRTDEAGSDWATLVPAPATAWLSHMTTSVVSTEGPLGFARGRLRPEWRDLLSMISRLLLREGLSAPRFALRSRRRKLAYAIALPATAGWSTMTWNLPGFSRS